MWDVKLVFLYIHDRVLHYSRKGSSFSLGKGKVPSVLQTPDCGGPHAKHEKGSPLITVHMCLSVCLSWRGDEGTLFPQYVFSHRDQFAPCSDLYRHYTLCVCVRVCV